MHHKLGVLAIVVLNAAIASARSPCACTRDFRPVCGSDGTTYSNECNLNCERSKGKTDLVQISTGPCTTQDENPDCICTFEYKPVCGNDGKTYPNRCAMQCTSSENPNIEVAYEGQCTPTPSCVCTDDIDYVCGSNGETYSNPCNLNCATTNDNTLAIKHQGRCVDAVKVADLPTPPLCTCTRDLEPVCGSNGVTYNNACLLNCAAANDSTLSIKYEGKCEDVKVEQPSCNCARDLQSEPTESTTSVC